jgi:ferredoxin
MRHSQNAAGRFWVDQDACVACRVCTAEAPDNFLFDDLTGKAYVSRQPATPEELHAVSEAVSMCPVEAPRDDS